MSEKYYHGVRVKEEGTQVAAPVMGTTGLQVVFGTAPVNLASQPEAAVNVPVVCRNMEEAKKKLGYSNDFGAYTLCQSMYASFVKYTVAPVVFINVLDPKVHKKENPEKEYAVINRQAKVEKGILLDSVTVKVGETSLNLEEDYLLSFDDDGYLVVTLFSERTEEAKSLLVTSASIDPSLVSVSDIIGGYDAKTGKESGMEVLRQVYPKTGMAPGLLLAPGWSHKPEVGAVMMAKCESINGVFSAECLLDLDTEKARLYTDVPKVKEESGYADSHAIVLWPKVMVDGMQMYYSAAYGAMTAYADVVNDNVPNRSPSNCALYVDAAVLEDGTEVLLDREQANTLNANGIVTLLNEGSWHSWGNNTSAYPEVTEAKDRWICCRRMFTWMANSLITTYHNRVDDKSDFRLLESICDSENIRLNSYVSAGKMAGGRIEFNESENNLENILNGQIIFRIYIAVFTPAEDILFVLKFDPELLRNSLTRGGEA